MLPLKVPIWLCCFQQAPESLPVSFVPLLLIEISFNCFTFASESFTFRRAIISLSPAPDTARVLLSYYLWMYFLK